MGCRIHAALLLWLLGYPEQALARLHEALALAHELPDPYSLAHARCWAAQAPLAAVLRELGAGAKHQRLEPFEPLWVLDVLW